MSETKRTRPILDHLAFCWSYARPWRIPLTLGILTIAVEAALENLPPLITKSLIDDVLTPGRPITDAWPLLSALIATIVGIALVGWLHVKLLYASSIRVVAALRVATYRHLQRLSMAFHEDHASGDLLSRLMEDVDLADDLISRLADELVVSLIGIAAALGLMLYLSWQLTVAALLPVPILLFLISRFTSRIRPLYRRIRDHKGDLYGRTGETLGGIRVMKAFSREDYELERFAERHDAYNEARLASVGEWGRWMPAIHLARNSGLVFVLALGTHSILTHSGITIGVLVAFVMYVQFFYQPFSELFGLYDRVLRASAAMDRVRDVLGAPVDVLDAPEAAPIPRIEGRITFEDVTFRYRSGETVLHRVSLDVAPGETVALVGSSGAGKTSIASLVARFYDPVEGVVRIDARDVRSLTQASLRSQMGIVPQETFLFNDTIRENIRYGRPDADEASVEKAARAARAHDFVERLADGYGTIIGERGVRLSAGQKQRLALARALVADPRVLILDEPTSQLDAESESHIQEALDEVRRGRTTLIIAHRLSTIRKADRILVVEDGRIAEEGTHDELLRMGGRYQELHALQLQNMSTPLQPGGC